ncbi:hypothetical protein [Mesorhizobium huakuii]|uniref:Uncharacterized protein n=1 Tax=Mesorhizobium huakuii TaxID=28104 RepID=A0ABZ0VYP9_9HYPH|nr:hypothetical protein [Mesorhizobium huakuii]WQC02562.1 hypothetical protein U0R22_006812 [Mesorhizobium huakuii]
MDTTTPSYLGQSEYGYQRGETDANGHSQEETGLYEASLFVVEHSITRRWLNKLISGSLAAASKPLATQLH